jgi:hypothetical protein
MLLKILKLFGLDVPAKIEAAKASFERRVEQATDHVKQVAQEAAVIAAFSAVAAVTATMAFGVGLIALYRWTADAYGAYAGLGVVGAILVVVTVIFAMAATTRSKSLASHAIRLPRSAASTAGATAAPEISTSPAEAPAYAWETPAAATPVSPPVAASDLVEPLALLLSKVVKYPSVGNAVVDELLGNLRATAHGTTDEAIDRAANVIRHGDRANLVVVLTGAAFVGWLLSHHSRQ